MKQVFCLSRYPDELIDIETVLIRKIVRQNLEWLFNKLPQNEAPHKLLRLTQKFITKDENT